MSINIFNYTNQKLSAENMRKLNNFSSANYGGVVSKEAKSPFTIRNNLVSWNTPFNVVGGGLEINIDSKPTNLREPQNGELVCLLVNLEDVDSANITTDVLNSDALTKITTATSNIIVGDSYVNYSIVDTIQVSDESNDISFEPPNPKFNGWYEEDTSGDYVVLRPTEDEEVDSTKTYYYQIVGTSVKFDLSYAGTNHQFNYCGTTLWLGDRNIFVIPLYGRTSSGELIQIVSVSNYEDFNKLLSTGNYNKLKTECEEKFVWSEGGKEPVGLDGHAKGDIGKLNIAENVVSNNVGGRVIIDKPSITNIDDSNNPATLLALNEDGDVVCTSDDYVIPVNHGGTGSSERSKELKNNIGIYYNRFMNESDTEPKAGCFPTGYQAKEGDLFFRIIG